MPPKKQIDYKGRIIFLHGYTQTSSIFYAKTSALRKKLQKLKYKSVYLNGPYKLTPAQLPSNDALSKFNSVVPEDEEDTNLRAWWIKKDYYKDAVEISLAVDTIKDYINNGKIIPDDDSTEDEKANDDDDSNIPIVGIIGFSQGAALGGLLAHDFKDIFGIELKFAVLYSGFKIDTSKESASSQYDKYYTQDGGQSDNFKLLHVYGELDTVVSEERSVSLYNHSKTNSDILKHPGGHFVPNSKLLIDQVTNWILHTEIEQQPEKPKEEDSLDDLMDMMDNLGKA
ncbi:hypothetical protein HYPBUDRAFT_210587 [Hyphopichia burtonii NRRL Y-1933]|uniref:Serine hydrolase domain-containing protein n=1 Tax=Hyphopichia burtonii NRRL Y-1933 TaxID=984485 RepID=A0A1E4RJB5_9ASCO|nr:hypothetical protein HYPBUDRAFT_210587 [Hyphopichia burtonii NRRL Y-1933]ODV67367.1 hypothetical protein HYPBUDRAFT_210587 [Hyphopichia burtonii NRRL Y-1933]